MRLLKRLPSDGFELVTCIDDTPPLYAILSHTWIEDQEPTYDELVSGTGRDKTGYAKIRFCGEQAAADGLDYFWIDTCCINKSASEELSIAINSVFRWYQSAARCYVYLSDVLFPEEIIDTKDSGISWEYAFRHSRWFTRGWTLPELLAPTNVEFFSRNGRLLGSRASLEQDIHEITGIPVAALRRRRLSDFSIEDRMSWGERRTTMRKEDKAYCLLGIFSVSMSLVYGEGEEHAMLRLKGEIQKGQKDHRADNLQNMPDLPSLPSPRDFLAAQLERLVPDGEHMDKEAYNTYFFQTIHAAASNSMVGRAASASLLDRVGRCQASRGQYSTAEETHRQALSVRKDVLGHDHLKTLVSMNNVAGVLSGQGSYAEAETMHRETLKLSKKVLGNEHLATLTSMSNLAGALGQQKKYSEAEEMHRETLELRKKMLGNEHPHTLLSMYGLAHLLAKQLLYDDSRFLYEQACAGYDVALGRDHFIARACHQHYRQMLALQQRDRIEFRSKVPESGVDVSGSKRRKEI